MVDDLLDQLGAALDQLQGLVLERLETRIRLGGKLCGEARADGCRHHVGNLRRSVDDTDNLCERLECGQHRFSRQTEIDQAGDLVDAAAFQMPRTGHGLVDGSEQTAILEVALESELEDGIQLLLFEAAEIEIE